MDQGAERVISMQAGRFGDAETRAYRSFTGCQGRRKPASVTKTGCQSAGNIAASASSRRCWQRRQPSHGWTRFRAASITNQSTKIEDV
ncbi:hypothetical protein GCM10027514_36110 [Azotobacter armeniacus]